jgi:hypothetical protein
MICTCHLHHKSQQKMQQQEVTLVVCEQSIHVLKHLMHQAWQVVTPPVTTS